MLTGVDKLLLGLWLLPLGLGLVVGLRAGDDEGPVLLFVSGIVAAMYLAVLAGMLHHARRRRRWADLVAADRLTGRTDRASPAVEDVPQTPGERGRLLAVRALPLLLVVPAAVHLVAAEGGWTSAVIAAQLITVVTMAAHVHRGSLEPGPASPWPSA
ncbi:hypothetical protein GMA12_06750 [Kocuria sediminis]|uniref:Uncharacterized protein n=1 Tax=Kocuria sediminis TaxID=1038857 RepID=A0A6N8GKR3_9MICC|nr:hypothetical protein [Kocuria sediminis]MUN62840.1 hypothetical protein [Kocuria sediminis]